MKVFSVVIALINISISSSYYTLERIEAIPTSVEVMNYDPEGNLYVVTKEGFPTILRLYKLNPSKEVSWITDLPSSIIMVSKMLVTSQSDVYFTFEDGVNQTFAVLRSNSSTVEEVEQYRKFLFYLDGNDNLFYCREDGVNVLRPNSTVPTPIKNLRNLIDPLGSFATDQIGNVYLSMDGYVALISKKALQEEVPYAELFLAHDLWSESINEIQIDENNDLWVFVDHLRVEGFGKKLINGTLETIFTEHNRANVGGIPAKGKIYVSASDTTGWYSPSIYYVNLDNDEIVDIPELKQLQTRSPIYGLTDRDGNTYFRTLGNFTTELSPMIVIKSGEANPISLFNTDVMINEFALDFNDDVWIRTGYGLYYLKKGDIRPELIRGQCSKHYGIRINHRTKEVYLLCLGGLYIVVNKT